MPRRPRAKVTQKLSYYGPVHPQARRWSKINRYPMVRSGVSFGFFRLSRLKNYRRCATLTKRGTVKLVLSPVQMKKQGRHHLNGPGTSMPGKWSSCVRIHTSWQTRRIYCRK